MKLPLVCVSLSLMLLGACAPHLQYAITTLSDGRHAITIDSSPSTIDYTASELCPFGYIILSSCAYQNFPRIAYERRVIVCNPLPRNFPR